MRFIRSSVRWQQSATNITSVAEWWIPAK